MRRLVPADLELSFRTSAPSLFRLRVVRIMRREKRILVYRDITINTEPHQGILGILLRVRYSPLGLVGGVERGTVFLSVHTEEVPAHGPHHQVTHHQLDSPPCVKQWEVGSWKLEVIMMR